MGDSSGMVGKQKRKNNNDPSPADGANRSETTSHFDAGRRYSGRRGDEWRARSPAAGGADKAHLRRQLVCLRAIRYARFEPAIVSRDFSRKSVTTRSLRRRSERLENEHIPCYLSERKKRDPSTGRACYFSVVSARPTIASITSRSFFPFYSPRREASPSKTVGIRSDRRSVGREALVITPRESFLAKIFRQRRRERRFKPLIKSTTSAWFDWVTHEPLTCENETVS